MSFRQYLSCNLIHWILELEYYKELSIGKCQSRWIFKIRTSQGTTYARTVDGITEIHKKTIVKSTDLAGNHICGESSRTILAWGSSQETTFARWAFYRSHGVSTDRMPCSRGNTSHRELHNMRGFTANHICEVESGAGKFDTVVRNDRSSLMQYPCTVLIPLNLRELQY